MHTTDISTAAIRAHFARITLPEGTFTLGKAINTTDLPKLIDTQLARLESEAPILRRLAFDLLQRIAEKLEQPLPAG